MRRFRSNAKSFALLDSPTHMATGTINAVLDSGLYFITPDVQDLPESSWFFAIIITMFEDSLQVLFSFNGSKLYTRRILQRNGTVNPDNWRCVNIPEFSEGGS